MYSVKKKLRLKYIICLLLVALILAAYWQLPTHGFVNLDDNRYITQNEHVKMGVTWQTLTWAFNFDNFAYWHPVTWICHMLFFQLFGMNPSMHHMMNLFLHIANSLLLFLVFKRMTGEIWQSAFVAALFALHPLNVESVAWASELKNVLSTFFWMATLFGYVRYVERPGINRYLIVLLVFALGLMAKPMLVTLPFVLLLLDYWPLNRLKFYQSTGAEHGFFQPASTENNPSSVLTLILEKIPFLFLSAVCVFLSNLSFQHKDAVISTALVPMKLRIANAVVSYIGYIRKIVWPYHIGVFYPFPRSIPSRQVMVAGLLLLFLTFWAFRLIKKSPYLVVGWLWFIGTLVPAIGLVQAGLWPAMADRFVYVPAIGLFIGIAWGVPDLLGRWGRKKWLLGPIAAALVFNFTVATRLQNRYWKNNITLFRHALQITHKNAIAHEKLGEALFAKGKDDEAARQYHEALRITSDLIGANLNLGVILREQGKFDKAIEHFSKVIQTDANSADARYEIAVTQEKKGDLNAAVRYYSAALRIKPEEAKIHNHLGIALALQNKEKIAIFHFSEALRINPSYVGASYNLAKMYTRRRNMKKAIFYLKKTLKLNPNMAPALYRLSWILASDEDDRYRNGEEAVRLATKLCKITGYTQPLSFDALAAAYAETGNFDAAVLTAQKGIQLLSTQNPHELASGLKKRLKLYKAKKPYRQFLQRKNASQING